MKPNKKLDERYPKENVLEDTEAQDRKRAYHLGMTYEDFIKRKAELMRQIEKVKETQAP